jgi:hypothetical protein
MAVNADTRGENLRRNLRVAFETFPEIPLHYLFSVIDFYMSSGYLIKHEVVVDTTIKPLLPDRIGALGIAHIEKKQAATTMIVVIVDLAQCKNDSEVVTVMAHHMSHAHCYLKTGRADIHGNGWMKQATIYAQALGIEEIAHRKREPCFQLLTGM